MKLLKIDELLIDQHPYLSNDDECYYIREYTARQGYHYSDTNSLIKNFKKPIDREGFPEWQYKKEAIKKISKMLFHCMPPNQMDDFTLIPIPPSKHKDDPLFDNRMTKVLLKYGHGAQLDIRELLQITKNYPASHEHNTRLTPKELKRLLIIDEEQISPHPRNILLFDDMITTGSHFVACKKILQKRFKNATVRGIFVARRKPPE